MEDGSLLLWLSIIVSIPVAILSTGLITAIFELNWAKLRKLDASSDKGVIEQLKYYLTNRIHFHIALRLISFLCLSLLAIAVFKLAAFYYLPKIPPKALMLVSGLIATVIFASVTEVFGRGLLGSVGLPLVRHSGPFLRGIHIILLPFLNLITTLQKRLRIGSQVGSGDKSSTVEEIISLIESATHEHPHKNALEALEGKMIMGIFHLEETMVKEIMTPRVDLDAIHIDATIEEVKMKIVECGHSRIPVFKDRIDEIVGFIFAKDLLNDGRIREIESLRELLHTPMFIPETKYVSDLLEEFRQTKSHIAVIIDEYGGTAGVVTFEDILEEIVGEIQDEYDTEDDAPPQVSVKDDGSVVVDARMPIHEINELLDVSISEDEGYDTIGGYVSSELGRIPKPRETVQLDELQAQILLADQRKIGKMALRKVDTDLGEESANDENS